MPQVLAPFAKLPIKFEVKELKTLLDKHPSWWDYITIRQNYPDSAHHSTDTIYIRGPEEFTRQAYQENTVARDFVIPTELEGLVKPLIASVVNYLGADEVGYAMLVSLYPNSHVDPHIDEGKYARYFTRFHLPIYTNDSVLFNCDTDTVHMREGELWWFNHQKEHSVVNYGTEERIHLILDVRFNDGTPPEVFNS